MDRSATIPTQADDKFRLLPPQLSLPKGGGAVRGIGEKFTTNAVTGTGSMSIPIATSPGRSGFGPQLVLTYDSGHGNGPFGLGWQLSLPAITRKTEKGLPQYFDAEESDVFVLSGVEDLVPVLVKSGSTWIPEPVPNQSLNTREYAVKRYRPRIEGLFARIERWTNVIDAKDVFWRSISKDNVTTWYGKTSQNRIADPNDPFHVFSWLACESRDDKGNAILYEYVAEDSGNVVTSRASEAHRDETPEVRTAGRYIKRVRYGNRVSHLVQPDLSLAQWLFEVVFDFGEGHYAEEPPDSDKNIFASAVATPAAPSIWLARLDPFSSRRSGFEVRSYRLCQRVLMIHHFDELAADAGADYLVRATEFSYQPSPLATVLISVSQSGFVWDKAKAKFLKRSLPPIEFTYSAIPTPEQLAAFPIERADPEGMENLPVGLDGAEYLWADLKGEGISGVIVLTRDTVRFKPNLGGGRFGPLRNIRAAPSLAAFGAKSRWQDITGGGRLDLVVDEGFYREPGEDGTTFRYFRQVPTVERNRSDLHYSDQTGDGRADVMVVEGARCTLYESLGEQGFASGRQVWMSHDELPESPTLVADMTGDGLPDLLTIRNGSVRYRPSLGYGRFGPSVTMDNSPWLDAPDEFDPRRIRLADVDGSGTTDILYFAADGVRLYYNESGNGWSNPILLPQFQCVDPRDDLSVVDLLGNGTACLVWSSPAPSRAERPLLYLDLMGGQKPHLLTRMANNLGAETVIAYASSTHFYLEDQREGRPWMTRLPFPVHVVEKIETYDRVSRNRFVSRYSYHHGYFDGVEREFRGFGMVEQWDTEQLAALVQSTDFPTGDNVTAASHVPPIHVKTWFHTGVYFGGKRVSDYFAGLLEANDIGQYFREPGLSDAQARTLLLDDTVLPPNLSVDEEREACRALKGSMLRQETYALDGSERETLPYIVTEQNFGIECLQPQSGQRHTVFFSHPREAIRYHYERRQVPVVGGNIVADGGDTSAAIWQMDPRVQHELTLKVDAFGNVLSAATIYYGRRFDSADSALSAEDRKRQRLVNIIVTSSQLTNAVIDQIDAYRSPMPAETLTCEMRKPQQEQSSTGLTSLYPFAAVAAAIDQAADGLHEVQYEDFDFAAAVHAVQINAAEANKYFRRPIEQSRVLYRPDDLGASKNDPDALLSLGQLQPLALPGERYKLAFTPGLLDQVYQRGGQALLPANPSLALAAGSGGGGYVSSDQCKAAGVFPANDANGFWWLPSGRAFLSMSATDTAAQESSYAGKHFYLPLRTHDPFGGVSTVSLDKYDLLPVQTSDPLGNLTTVGERKPANAIDPAVAGNDYRVLQASCLMDPNRNRSQLAFDALGMVVGTALCGKPEENLGDSLAGFRADLDEAELLEHLNNPLGDPWSVLAGATTRLLYDFDGYRRSIGQPDGPQPACVYTLARETHLADEGGQPTKVQHSLSYSDGFGREIQRKVQAEPVTTGSVVGPPRWITSGWVVFNNKGKKILQYDPFFSDTQEFQFGVLEGVSAVLFYDAAERVVATLHPNSTYEKVVFDPWRQRTYDVNDTVSARDDQTGDPRTDPDIAGEVQRYFDAQPATVASAWKTWYQQRIGGGEGVSEQQAAKQAADHANTPTSAHFDALGRPFLTLAHNRVVCPGHALDGAEDEFATRSLHDIEGNEREVQDAEGRIVMRYDFDMLGNRIHQSSMEAGERWMLGDVAGKPICAWDSRGHNFTTEYDALRRPARQFVLGTSSASDPRTFNKKALFEMTEYGEGQPLAVDLNLCTRVFRHSDSAGVVTCLANIPNNTQSEAYDFKGNLLRSGRRLVADYTTLPDWMNSPTLDQETFTRSTRYDALNRATQIIAPHSDQNGTLLNVVQHVFNEANLLDRADVWLAQTAEPGAPIDPAVTAPSAVGVTNIDYNEKGQRILIEYRNGAKTSYSYDLDTHRLTNLKTTRPAGSNGPGAPIFTNAAVVQDLHYTYDPAGNITGIEDAALQTVIFGGQQVDPVNTYIYDAIYRLIEATGREHIGQTASDFYPPNGNRRDYPFVGLRAQPFDAQAMRNYTESYVYDAVGNFDEMRHAANGGSWTRTYTYAANSLIESGKKSNRLTRTVVGNGTNFNETYAYADAAGNDAQGCMTAINDMKMVWDFKDRLQQVDLGAGRTAYYSYDASGERARKVIETSSGVPQKQRTYLGGFEDYHEYNASNGTLTLKREALHVMDEKQRIALVETRTSPTTPDPNDPLQLIRYQFGNHLGSASLEMDEAAQLISYEEYSAYGSTSYQTFRNQAQVAKRYRYIGEERDEETGLSCHGARFYAPWLGRWLSCDPLSLVNGPNVFAYVSGSPICRKDPEGTNWIPPDAEFGSDSLKFQRALSDLSRGRISWSEYYRGAGLRDPLGPQVSTISRDTGNSIPLRQIEAEWKAAWRGLDVIRSSLLGGTTYTIRRELYGDTQREAVARAEAVANLEQAGVGFGGLYAQGKASGVIKNGDSAAEEHVGGTRADRLGNSRVNDVDPSESRSREACVPSAAAVIARGKAFRSESGASIPTVTSIERVLGTPIGTATGERSIPNVESAVGIIETVTGAKLNKTYFKEPGVYVLFVPQQGGGHHAITGWIPNKGETSRRYLYDASGQNYQGLGKARHFDPLALPLPKGTLVYRASKE